MALLKALRKVLTFVFITVSSPVWLTTAYADAPLWNFSSLSEEMLGLQRDLLVIEQKDEAKQGNERILIYLDVGNVPELKLESVELVLDGEVVVVRSVDAEQRAAFEQGGMEKLYVGRLAPGQHTLQARFSGVFNGAYSHEKTYPFETEKGITVMRVAIIDVMHQQQSELVFFPEFVFHQE